MLHQIFLGELFFVLYSWGVFFLGAINLGYCQESSQLHGLNPQKAISQYQHDVWKKENGLPQNSVFSVLQTAEGYLWVATYEGLGRYDGAEFVCFNSSNVPEMLTSSTWKLFEDSYGTLWIGTNNGGLIRYKKGNFKTYTTEQGLYSNVVIAIAEDDQKKLWIGTRNGLSQMQEESFQTFTTVHGLVSNQITALQKGQDQTLWIGTNRGLMAYKQGRFEDYNRKILLTNRNVTAIYQDKNRIIWIGTPAGLLRYDEQIGKQDLFTTKEGLTDDYITDLLQDSRGTLWIGTQNGGLNRITPQELYKPKPRFDSFTIKQGLSANSINSLFEDVEGSLWIGVNRGGLNRLRDGKFTNITTNEGLSDNIVNCILEDQDGALWIGTLSGGVNYLKNGKIKQYDKTQGLPNNHVRSIMQAQDGSMWFATYGGGIAQLQNQTIKVYTDQDGLASNITRSIYQTRDGNIWVGTRNGLSMLRNKQFTTYTTRNGLPNNSIIPILEDSKGNLWVGTDGGGVAFLKPNEQKFIALDSKKGLANDLVFAFYEDKETNLWIGTKGGLSLWKDGKLQSILPKDGLPNDAIYSITEDKEGNLWMSCNSGVFSVNKKQIFDFFAKRLIRISCRIYQEEDGMKSSDCAGSAQPTVCKDRNGNLWYPTTKGISMLNPESIKINQLPPSIVIKEFLVDNKPYPIDGELIELPAGSSKIEFDFAALSFLAPNRIVYRYKLEGFDNEWIEIHNKHEVFYTNLAPGKYTFRLKAANNDGIWNEQGIQLKFYIKPFFYQTWWFYISASASLISLGFLLYFWRIHSLERAKMILERSIAERTIQISEQYRKITQQAEELERINNIVRTLNKEVHLENVLKTVLEQGIHLFDQAQKGIFLLKNPQNNHFDLVAQYGYEDTNLAEQHFEIQKVQQYCQQGKKIEEDLWLIEPAKNSELLTPQYQPETSVAMPIYIENDLKGVMFLDNYQKDSVIENGTVQRLLRFKEHAVSAFSKANFLREIEEKNQVVENSLKKVADSIRYARRIQRTILGSQEEIISYFKDAFIFYEPKDIVSGDFYWFTETLPEPKFDINPDYRTSVFKGFTDPKLAIAAVDCTGHGVPGAFMTVIGYDLLNTIVIEEKIIVPHKILHKLDQGVKKFLKQEEGGQINEGMDIALLMIDFTKQIVEFAGAKNPLLYVRNGEMHIVSASKYPIGGSQIKHKSFQTHTIPYQEGDAFYIFTDGFQDQFGGERDSKYTTRRFREFLLSISHLPMPQQREKLAQELNTWKGDRKQTDDVLVIGIRF
ncbi:MAG: SpoIIE family protein phosphatase [Microscillaceae bacterium]|nr:SpoIIE family protein phosphatase [Microscillaceae bacterium]MDW8460028.1 two-component regulator propeller domain-containing protein [Cytophagales bacterium]